MAKYLNIAWELGCILSVVGIWGRYVEPNLLTTVKIDCPIQNLPQDLDGFRIVQFSDLHLNKSLSDGF